MAPRAGQLVKEHAAGYHRTSDRPQRGARSGIGDFQHGRRRHCPGAEVYLRIIVLTEACRRGEVSAQAAAALRRGWRWRERGWCRRIRIAGDGDPVMDQRRPESRRGHRSSRKTAHEWKDPSSLRGSGIRRDPWSIDLG
jgi:hypothetical protein